MTHWVEKHPGGSYSIMKWSENNGTFIIYPSVSGSHPHGMANWNNNWHKFTYIGRFGDDMNIGDLPNDLKTVDVTNYFSNTIESMTGNTLVCGSPGEVGNLKGEDFLFDSPTYETFDWHTGFSRKYVWINIALNAPDQLRQRVAWSLSQVSLILTNDLGFLIHNLTCFYSYISYRFL